MLVEIDNAGGLTEEEALEATAVLALQRLRRVKVDGIDIPQLLETQRMIEDNLGIYGCALDPDIDVGLDWQPEER